MKRPNQCVRILPPGQTMVAERMKPHGIPEEIEEES